MDPFVRDALQENIYHVPVLEMYLTRMNDLNRQSIMQGSVDVERDMCDKAHMFVEHIQPL